METKRVLVLMSTYNGEKYLQEQLDSIFSQKGVDVSLIIRDDGSTDRTIELIQAYTHCSDGRIVLIKGENIGWKESFHTLIREAASNYREFDYFAFSDQDDIWLPDKLQHAVEALEKLPEGAALYCSNQFYYRDGKVGSLINHSSPLPTEKRCLLRNYATGCTIVFNRHLLEYLAEGTPNYPIAHDYWCYMVAVLCGKVIIDPNAYIWYRQHEDNQIGIKTSWIDTWRRRLKSVSSLFGDRYRERVAQELLRLQESNMTDKGRKAVEKLAYYRKNLTSRLALLLDKGYTLDKKSNDFWFKLRVIFGYV